VDARPSLGDDGLIALSRRGDQENRMRRSLFLGFVFVTLMGCGGEDSGPETPGSSDFAPAPGPGEIQIRTPVLPEVKPGEDKTFCTYLEGVSDKTIDVTKYLGFQPKTGHHTVLYAVDGGVAPGTHECTDNDMLTARYIAGGGSDATTPSVVVPDGVVFRIPKGTQYMILSHWINVTSEPVRGQAAFNLKVVDPSPDAVVAGMFSDATTQIDLKPGLGSARAECVMQQPMQFFTLGGHAHEWGTRVQISVEPQGGTPEMIYDVAWSKDKVLNTLLLQYKPEAPLKLAAGDKLIVDCTYNNIDKPEIVFPTEMCVAFGYFFPAEREIDCVDGVWPTP
jgi:hypothetical protein